MKKKWLFSLCTLMSLVLCSVAFAGEKAVCYNCPPMWADWASQLKAIEQNIKITLPHDNKNSGQTLSQLIAEKGNPVADVAYYGVSFGIKAKEADVVASYKPAHWEDIPQGLKDPEGYWFTIHSGTIGFFVNKDALGGAPVPRSWSDLLKPEYKGMVGYLDPTSAFVGYASGVAANLSLGGSLDNFDPGITFFKNLKKNKPIVPKQTSYARVISGEIPIGQALHQTTIKGLALIPTGVLPPNPAELLLHKRFSNCLSVLTPRYDLSVIPVNINLANGLCCVSNNTHFSSRPVFFSSHNS